MPGKIDKINPNEILEIGLSVNKNKNAKIKTYSGSLIFKHKDFNLELPISVDVQEKKAEPAQSNTKSADDSSGKGKLLYWIVPFVVIFIFGIVIFLRARKPKKESFEDFLKSIQEKK